MPEPGIPRSQITAVILAGGQARRMGGRDKGLVMLRGKPMIEHVLKAMQPQAGAIVINANRHLETYGRLGCPVVSDLTSGYDGPLAGMASGMRAACTPFVVTAPCDCPRLPGDLVERLAAQMVSSGAQVCTAHSGERIQPVFSLIAVQLLDPLCEYLARGERKIDHWFREQDFTTADFSDQPRAFVNVNTPEELAAMEAAWPDPPATMQ